MGAIVVDRRRLLLGGSAGVGLGALTLMAPSTASAAGIETRAALRTALDRYAATRVGTIGLTLRDNRDGGYFAWRPLTLQSLSTVKVLILVATLKRAQDRRLSLTSTQKSLASRMIRNSDNAATDTLLAQIGVSTCQRVADGGRCRPATGSTRSGSSRATAAATSWRSCPRAPTASATARPRSTGCRASSTTRSTSH